MTYVQAARSISEKKLSDIRKDLLVGETLAAGKACVYATGSFGRHEAGALSDLDLFIVIQTRQVEKYGMPNFVNALTGLQEIKLKSLLIDAVERNDIAEFDGEGKYLESHRFSDFTKWLGTREDDYRNTLTGRMLLLLESKCLINDDLYSDLIDSVIDGYFTDYADNKKSFIPAFLVNDILRMWRTFCVNYESRRRKGNADSRIKNLKLKYSRMITCYSAVISLLHIYVLNGAVSPQDVKEIVLQTPTERLDKISTNCDDKGVKMMIGKILESYSLFLELVHKDKESLESDFNLHESEWKERSYQFGCDFFSAISMVNGLSNTNNALFRMIVV